MNETAGMLEARLGLIERIRKVEHALARSEQARVAQAVLRGKSHDLGNAIQIVKLTAVELQRRLSDEDTKQLIVDMNASADDATRILAEMVNLARPPDRRIMGAIASHTIRAAVELARPALVTPIDLRIDLDDTVHTYCSAQELEAIVLASALDAIGATRMTYVLRERLIQNKRWVELMRVDDRQLHDGDYAHMFEDCSLLRVVSGAAKEGGGEASLSPGRAGLELVVELPVASKA